MFSFLFFRHFRQIDWLLLILVFLLVVFGLIAQYSLSLGAGGRMVDFVKQLIVTIFGFLLIVVLIAFDFRLLKPLALLLYFLTMIMLILVLLFGQSFRGVKGWLGWAGFQFQVVEIAKIAIIIVLARLWQTTSRSVYFWSAIKSLLLILPVIILVLLQPDLGSAIVLFLIWLGMLLLVDNQWRHYLVLLILIVLIIIFGYSAILKDYQKERILVYLDPGRDPFGQEYQINQAKIALGSGRLFGRGFGYGTQSQLRFLPARKTDFIFAVIGEEFGFVGSFLVLILFFLFFRRVIRFLVTIYDNFGRLVVSGILINIFIHLFFNISVNLGLLPVVGLPLPFISYGGSALIVNLFSIGLIESVIVHQALARKVGEV